jgi:predicted dehydrogenase
MPQISWAILSTGAISDCFARAVRASRTGQVLAVASRSADKAAHFAAAHRIPRHYPSYEALLSDKDVQAVYISTPHPQHAQWAIQFAAAGKHLLVEKPITMNLPELLALADAARSANVLVMEAFMYRCHPQTARIVELIRQKAIGEVRIIQAAFCFQNPFDPQSRLFSNALGGGGILDVGCYTASMARLIAGAAIGWNFADPLELKATARLMPTGVDGYSAAAVKFPGDIIAQLACGVHAALDTVVLATGSEGRIFIPNPWVCDRRRPETGLILLHRHGDPSPVPIAVDAAQTSFTYQADVFGDAVLADKTTVPSPAMTLEDSIGNMKTLDAWRHSAGVVYDAEKR